VSQETCQRLVALALVQGMVGARFFRLSDERAAGVASVRVAGACVRLPTRADRSQRTPPSEVAWRTGDGHEESEITNKMARMRGYRFSM